MRFTEGHCYWRHGLELLKYFDEESCDKRRVHAHLTNGDLRDLRALPYGKGYVFELDRFVRRLLQPLERRSARVKLAPGPRDKAGRLDLVDLQALFTARWKPKVPFGLEAMRRAKYAQPHVAI